MKNWAWKKVANFHPLIGRFGIYLVFPNLLFYLLGNYLFMMRPIVNVDYFLIGSLSFLLRSEICFILFASVLANDLLINLAPIFHFRLENVFRSLKDLIYLDTFYTGSIAFGGMCILGCLFFLITRSSYKGKNPVLSAFSLILIGCGFFAADVLNGSSFVKLPVYVSYADFNIAFSGIKRTITSLKSSSSSQNIRYSRLAPRSSSTDSLFTKLGQKSQQLNHNLGVVVVESLGLFMDSNLEENIFELFKAEVIRQRYDLEIGKIPFDGHTVNGEFRELCSVRLEAYGPNHLPVCLPALLKKQGYETVALHGFTNQFYNRYHWYPLIGFDQVFFASDFFKLGIKKKCGSAFYGLCDRSVANVFHNKLKEADKKQMVYWLTLNSHFPLSAKDFKNSKFDCSRYSVTRENPALCLHTQAVHEVLSSLSEVVKDPTLPKTQFFISGDHAPVFFDKHHRSFYSQSHVPYLILRPKTVRL